MREADRIRVLLIIPNLGRGGAQQVFRQQLQGLSSDFSITACVFNWDDAFEEDKIMPVISLDVPAGKNMIMKAWYFFLRVMRLRRLKFLNRIQVSISHLEGADYVNVLSSRYDKTLCWVHGTKKHDANIRGVVGAFRKRVLIPAVYKRADRIVCVSQGIADELATISALRKQNVHVIYNGFDVAQIAALSEEPLSQRYSALFKYPVVITHCRFSRQKNLFSLLEIFSMLKTRNVVKLVMIGDGELWDELISHCKAIGLSAWDEKQSTDDPGLTHEVYLLGHQRNPFRFLKAACLYIMTSDWEGFPLALCEAMICGLPVVAADCFTGPREILDLNSLPHQPVTSPVRNQYGSLMPLANPANKHVLLQWANEVEQQLALLDTAKQTDAVKKRIETFGLATTLRKTANLIYEVSV
jgi:glycosyltransferase involved in cell wall biosynthesis